MLVTSWDHESRDRVEKEENEQVKRKPFKARGHLLLRPREFRRYKQSIYVISCPRFFLFGEWFLYHFG